MTANETQGRERTGFFSNSICQEEEGELVKDKLEEKDIFYKMLEDKSRRPRF